MKLSLGRGSVMKQNSAAFLVGGLLAVGMFGLAKAEQLEDGEAAYFKHDYAKAVRLLRPLADRETPRRRIGSHQYTSGAAMARRRIPHRRRCGIAKPGLRERIGAGSSWPDA